MTANTSSRRLVVLAVTLAALAVWTQARSATGGAAAPPLASLSWTLGPWSGKPAPPLDPVAARILAADTYVRRFYTHGGATIEMDIAYYSRPRVGASMHSPLNCLPGNGWQIVEARTVPVELPQGVQTNVRRLLVGRGLTRIAMTYWFQNRSGIMAGEYQQRFRLIADGLRGRATDAALVRVMAPTDLRTGSGDAPVFAFTQQLIPVVRQSFE